jgi:uncharacterized protein YecE (DUF72 family)
MNNVKPVFRIGLGGWEHEVFDRAFYPRPLMDSGEKLAFYSRFFPTVEARQTFWDSDLTAADAAAWAEAVQESPGFTFCIKLHSSCTHVRSLRPEVTRNIRGLLAGLARRNRLGSLLIQFPYAFTNTSSNRFHVVKLAEIFSGFPLHAEFRHESWNFPGLLAFLREQSIGLAASDIPRIKHYMPFLTGMAGSSAYVRLHGRNEKGWLLNAYDAKYDYLYNARETREIERRLSALSPRAEHITVIANNATGGKSLPIAFQLLAAVRGGRPVPIPAATLALFPHLRSIATTEESLLLGGDPLRRAM